MSANPSRAMDLQIPHGILCECKVCRRIRNRARQRPDSDAGHGYSCSCCDMRLITEEKPENNNQAMKSKTNELINLKKKKKRQHHKLNQKRKKLRNKLELNGPGIEKPKANGSLANQDSLSHYTASQAHKIPHIDTSQSQEVFKSIQSTIEENNPEIKPYQHIPIYLIDTDKYNVDISALAAYQCIRRNQACLETINAERHLDQQLQESYIG